MFTIKNAYELSISNVLEECVYVVDVNTNDVLYLNNSLIKLIGTDNNTKVDYSKLLSKIDIPCHLDKVDDLQMDVAYKKYYYNEIKNLHYITKFKLTREDNRKILIQSFYDITEEFDEIKNLENKILANKAIIKCANTLLEDTGTITNIKKLLSIICDFYSGDRANLFLFNQDDNSIMCMYDYNIDDSNSILKQVKGEAIDSTTWRKIIVNNNFYSSNIEDVFNKNSFEHKLMTIFGVKSIMVSAIQRENENIGFIVVDNPRQKINDFDLLDTATIFLSTNIERQLFEDELKKSLDDIQEKIEISNFILKCAEILFKNKDITQAINQLLSVICGYFDADRCTLLEYMLEDECKCEHPEYVNINMTYEYCSTRVESLLENCKNEELHQDTEVFNKLKDYKCVFTKLDDLNITENSIEYSILKKNNVKSVMIVPLRKGENVTGLILLQNPSIKIDDINVLYTISGFLISELYKRDIVRELEHLSFRDKLTGLFNRNYYLRTIESLQISPPEKLGVIFADINGLKRVNDNLGHEYGDAFIRWCADFLNQHNTNYPVFRIGGDEFIAVVYDMDADEFFQHIKLMRDKLYDANLVNMSMGGTFVDGNVDINKQIVETDKIMYHEKQKYYILKKLMNVNVEAELVTLKNLLSNHL